MKIEITHAELAIIYRAKLNELRKRPFSMHGDYVEGAMYRAMDALDELVRITDSMAGTEDRDITVIDTTAPDFFL